MGGGSNAQLWIGHCASHLDEEIVLPVTQGIHHMEPEFMRNWVIQVIDAGDGKGKIQTGPINNVSVDEKEFYDFEIERLEPKGFGVQIGTYQELVNLMRLADNLKSSYQKKVTA